MLKMDKRHKPLLAIILIWFGWSLFGYYFTGSIFRLIYWLITNLSLLVLAAGQFVRLVRDRKKLDYFKATKVVILSLLFYLSFSMAANTFIEQLDWFLLSPLRSSIVENVKN